MAEPVGQGLDVHVCTQQDNGVEQVHGRLVYQSGCGHLINTAVIEHTQDVKEAI